MDAGGGAETVGALGDAWSSCRVVCSGCVNKYAVKIIMIQSPQDILLI